jgi:hypothetical protein
VVRRDAVALVVSVTATLGAAACGQLLGIQDVHDDPRDATAADSATDGTGLGDAAGDGNADATQAGDAASPDASDDTGTGALDAPFLDAPDAPDPSLGCPAGDAGGTIFYKASVATLTFAVDSNYLYAASSTTIIRCSIEGCSGPTEQIAQGNFYDLAANGRHVAWTTGGGSNTINVATPDGVIVGGRLMGIAGPVAAAGNDVWAVSQGNFTQGVLWQVIDGPSGIDASLPPVSTAVGTGPDLLAASPSYVAYALQVDAGTDVYVCPRTGCSDAAAPFVHVDANTFQSPPVLIGLDDSNFYYADPTSKTLYVCPVGGCAGVPQIVDQNSSGIFGLSVSAGTATWGGVGPSGEGIYMLAPDGGAPIFVTPSDALPGQIITTDRCVYWSEFNRTAPINSRVYAAPRP